MILVIFAKKEVCSIVSAIESSHIACGVGGVLGNKGGMMISFKVQNTSLSFINCHLAAGVKKMNQRIKNLYTLIS